jgi:hypothetical protein
MNYQFVNSLLFTVAGMLAGQKRRAQLLVASAHWPSQGIV